MTTKIDLINRAYSRLRISGLTVQPTPEDIDEALDVLEDMANQWGELMDSGYYYEETPDPNTLHNIPRPFWPAYKANLAVRLSPLFNLPVHPELRKEASSSYSMMCNRLAITREIPYPSRHPIGSGNSNKYNRYDSFYAPETEVPLEAETVYMLIGDIDDFYFDFSDYLVASETIQSYVLTADTGLTVLSDSIDSSRVLYQIRADGTGLNDAFLQVKIIVTFTSGRKLTKIRNFSLTDAD